MKEIQNTFRHDRTFKIHVVVCSSTLDHAIQDSITHGVDSLVAYLINISSSSDYKGSGSKELCNFSWQL